MAWAPDGTGSRVWRAQAVPFQTSEYAPAVELPTASHAFAVAHETLVSDVRLAPDGAGAAWAVQVVPFQPAAKTPPVLALPTVSQPLAERQDTPV
jgi:hypothetical protein